MIVTLDGPAGSGKSTVARALAKRLGLPCLNSGYIYRAVTVLALERGVPFEDRAAMEELIRSMELRFSEENDRTRVFAGGARELTARLKDPDVTAEVYRIANDSGYRETLVDLQRRVAQPHGVVAEGRDMGTVIFPRADHKFFLEAAPEVRARRQHADLEKAGHVRSFDEVLADVTTRDAHDRDRAVAPLRPAADATIVDTGDVPADRVVATLLRQIGVETEAPADAGGPGEALDRGENPSLRGDS